MTKTKILFCLPILACIFLALPVEANYLQSGTVIKSQSESVYYYAADNKRYVFPNQKTYLTWFADFNNVVVITSNDLANIPLGGNITYKPDSRLIKINTDPKVYYVDKYGVLRWIKSENVAILLFGADWNQLIDDVPDSFFVNYKMGDDIETASAVSTIPNSYSINQDKNLSTEIDPTYSDNSAITLNGTVSGNTIKLVWTLTNTNSPKGFKVVKSTAANPVYPGNDYHYLSESDNRSDTWSGLTNGTYHFRVCEYLGGACGLYSNDLTLTIDSSTANNPNASITLTKAISGQTVKLSWQLNNLTSVMGYKVVKAEHINPVYPGDDYHYLSDASATTDTWNNLDNGTYHFRVCEYLGGVCGVYSNDVLVTISETTGNEGAISLTASVIRNTVYLNWTVSTLTIDQGFKVVAADHELPVYPGDTYHYYADSNIRNDSWDNLITGTYHFRVCQYLGGACGVYSNDVTITLSE